MLTNFFPAYDVSDQFVVRVIPYSPEELERLRRTHNTTHSFFKWGDAICALWMEGSDLEVGETKTIRTDKSPDVVVSAIRHLLFRTFIRKLPALKPVDFYPLRFTSRKIEHDAVRQYLPDELKGVVTFRRLNELQARTISPTGRAEIGVLINITRRWDLGRTVKELIAEGFDVVGRPVVRAEPVPGLENILAPAETAVGVALTSGVEIAVGTPEGEELIAASELYLRKSATDIRAYLDFKVGPKRAGEIFYEIFHTDALGADASFFLAEIKDIADYLAQWTFATAGGFTFKIAKEPRKADVAFKLQETTFRFDISPGAAGPRPFAGLAKFGPYDSKRFTPKTPRILVVCRPESRAGFSTTIAALENGIPDSKYFQKGLRDFYHLNGIEWEIIEAPTNDPDQLSDALETTFSRNEGEPYSLAIVEGDELFATSDIAANPYYRAKGLLMSAGIPVQALQAHRTRLKSNALANVLGNLALQIYAKLGGTPWTLESSVDVDHEIVVGIGRYIERSSEYAGATTRRVVGLTTFFSSDGTFLMSHTCRAVPYEEYFEELLAALESRLNDLAKEYGWREGSTVRVVFHIFKPLKHIEADVVSQLVQRLPMYKIKYAFVTVATTHPYILFDDDPAQPKGRGYYIPSRMSNFVLDDLACLVQLRGRKEIKSEMHAFSRPVLVRVHPGSTFRDLHYIVQQVADFSFLSWRSFFPYHLPVTILYSNLIAEILDKLRRVPGWNPLAPNTTLRRRKWFL
jgi:Piwi domain.